VVVIDRRAAGGAGIVTIWGECGVAA